MIKLVLLPMVTLWCMQACQQQLYTCQETEMEVPSLRALADTSVGSFGTVNEQQMKVIREGEREWDRKGKRNKLVFWLIHGCTSKHYFPDSIKRVLLYWQLQLLSIRIQLSHLYQAFYLLSVPLSRKSLAYFTYPVRKVLLALVFRTCMTYAITLRNRTE